ncbi:hypothetical protein PMAC_002188 [Pneumocystis sp. 'macacae']|nr:hypothetical protein PMAC_002188 [Pneumocystis sp. 'macacae']
MSTNTNISEMHSIFERTLSFKKKFKKGKSLKVNKINVESESNKNVLNSNFVQNGENRSRILRLKDPEIKNKQFVETSRSLTQSLSIENPPEVYKSALENDFFSKNESFSQKSESSINSYASNLRIAEYSNGTSDVETFSDLKTSSTQSISHIYENNKNPAYNTDIKKSNSLSSASEKSGIGFFSSVLSAAQNAASSFTSLTTHTSLEDKTISKKLNNADKKNISKDLIEDNHKNIEKMFDTCRSLKGDFKKKSSTSIVPSIGYGELSLNDVKIQENTYKSYAFIDEKNSEKELSYNKELQKTLDNKFVNYSFSREKNHTLMSSNVLARDKFNISKKLGYPAVSCIDQQNKHNYITFKNNQQNTIHILIQQITGITIANNKRNKEFHTLFKGIPEDDYLIDDYASALQKDILLHGRMYISETYICFNSNIFGWITNLVISFLEVVSIDKKCTAVVFPNAIQITTLHAKYIFSSFISRDATYDLLINIWRLTNPSTRTHGAEINITDDQSSENYEKNSMTNELDNKTFEIKDVQSNRKDNINRNIIEKTSDTCENFSKKKKNSLININPNIEFSESKHQPTECSCLLRNEHYERQICDETIKGPLPIITNLCFGEEPTFMINFLENIQKVSEIKLSEWEKDNSGKKVRHISYLKPLYSHVGPKQTYCKIVETIEHKDNNYMTISSMTKTPDVPSGNSFIIKTKYCMMWAKDNYTRIIATCTTDWTKSSWLKSPIEKNINEGQISYIKDLIDAITNALKKPINGKYIEEKTTKKLELYKNENNINNKRIQKIYSKKINLSIKSKLFKTLKFTFHIVSKFSIFIMKINTIIIILLLIILFKIIQLEKEIQNISPLTNINYKTLNHYNSLWKQKENFQKCSESKIIYNIQIPKLHSNPLFDNIKEKTFNKNTENEKLQEKIKKIKRILRQIEKNF